MCTHHNSVYVFGGMDDERSEHMSMWKWDLSKDEGFEPVTYRWAHTPGLAPPQPILPNLLLPCRCQ